MVQKSNVCVCAVRVKNKKHHRIQIIKQKNFMRKKSQNSVTWKKKTLRRTACSVLTAHTWERFEAETLIFIGYGDGIASGFKLNFEIYLFWCTADKGCSSFLVDLLRSAFLYLGNNFLVVRWMSFFGWRLLFMCLNMK